MSKTFSFDYFGSTIVAQPLGSETAPPISVTLTAHCAPITKDGKIVAVNVIGRGVDIPGGHVDDNETAIEAMRRETHEEAFVTVGDPVLIDVWKLSSEDESLGLETKPYLLVYAANVVSTEHFVPNKEVSERLILTPEEFVAQYFGDKEQAQKLVDQAFAALE